MRGMMPTATAACVSRWLAGARKRHPRIRSPHRGQAAQAQPQPWGPRCQLELVPLKQLLPDHHALDLGRALADQEQRGVAVEALDLVLLRVAVAAVDAE